MNPRRVYRWVWWLLPLMVARAMLPVGFMPTMGGAGVEITLCSGLVLHQDPTQPADSAHSDFSCPFAQAGGAAPLPSVPAVAALAAQGVATFAGIAQLETSFGPLRADRVRGPPNFI